MKVTPTAHKLIGLTLPQGSPDTRPGFKESLEQSIREVNVLQNEAHQAMENLAVGKESNLHETMIAIQKAEVSFKMMAQVRNKIIDAYQEVMRMQV